MALNLYRRHRRECKAGYPEQSFSSEFEERKKGWKRCGCPIVASGTLQKRFKRQSTGQWEWGAARAIAGGWEAAGRWQQAAQAIPAAETTPLPSAAQTRLPTIPQARKTFLGELAEASAHATQKKYRLLLKRFETFSQEKGYVTLDQWEPIDVRQFRSTWPVSPQTAVRRMAELKHFFEYCVSNKWITTNTARAVKNPKSRDTKHSEQKFPFTDDELKRMYEACQNYGKDYHYRWKGEDLADFISIMTYTGLRISDTALFHIDRMNENGEIALRTTKAGTVVYTWVPEWLQRRIRDRAEKFGPHIFGAHKPTTLDIIAETWRRRLNRIFDACGPWKVEPTPHRFRHSFARILLQRGVSVDDVANLMGNAPEMVRKRYGAWVPERQRRIRQILQDAFSDKPKPKLVKIRP